MRSTFIKQIGSDEFDLKFEAKGLSEEQLGLFNAFVLSLDETNKEMTVAERKKKVFDLHGGPHKASYNSIVCAYQELFGLSLEEAKSLSGEDFGWD